VPDDDSKTLAILDKWKKGGRGFHSMKIRQAVKLLEAQEEKGCKITQWMGQQSRLPLLPPVHEIPKPEELEGLSYQELRTVFVGATEWKALAEKTIANLQRQR